MWAALPNRTRSQDRPILRARLDEYVIELGFNLMLNEHHQTTTCLNAAVPLTAAILARQRSATSRPRQPGRQPAAIRFAYEEMAMVDCIRAAVSTPALCVACPMRSLPHQPDPDRGAAVGGIDLT